MIENVPHAIHLFSFPEPGEPFTPALRSVLLHSRPVQQARWNPQRRGSMAACCGGRAMYMWSDEWVGEDGVAEEMAECVGVPASAYIDCSVDIAEMFINDGCYLGAVLQSRSMRGT